MTGISTHVLDTSLGRPAEGVPVELALHTEGGWKVLGTSTTHSDGRAKDLPASEASSIVRLLFDPTAYYAAWAADNEPETAPLAASMAKAYASDAGTRVTGASLQVHGGIGFTWEHDLHLFLKRAQSDAVLFGDSRWHRERVAELAGI